MGSLRYMPRAWERYLGPGFANVTEHHFRVAWIALILAAREGMTNTDKILKLALVHDISESRTGDVDYLSRQYVERNELLGIQDIFAGTVLEKEFVGLWEEYENLSSPEARLVKDADNLDLDMELREKAISGSPLEKIKHYGRKMVFEFKLNTATAKKLWPMVKQANPHDWHATSPRNRYVGGDWAKTAAKAKQKDKK